MIYVTSDLHGFDPEQFRAFLDKAGFCQDDYLFVLGDVIDRGEHGVALLPLPKMSRIFWRGSWIISTMPPFTIP